MSTFEDLRVLYAKWQDVHDEYEFKSMQFVQGFTNGFRNYIGAPDTNVEALQAIKGDDDEKIRYEKPERLTDVITYDENGHWLSGIRVVIERAENTFPKSHFTFPIRFVLRETKCEIHIGYESDGRFEFDMAPNALNLVYDYMISCLKGVFTSQPWDIREERTIGFVLPRAIEQK